MSKLIFRLNGASEEEAEQVRELLSQHELRFYETTAGRWGLSVAALWLFDESEVERARALIEDYQLQRQQQAREALNESRRLGLEPTLWQRARQAPLVFIAFVLATATILYLSIWPFIRLGG